MKCAKKLQQQMTSQKNDEEIDLMIIYRRFIESYLMPSKLTSPPWGNGKVEKGRSGVKWK